MTALPSIEYLEGANSPQSILTLPDAGDLSSWGTLEVIVCGYTPGDPDLFRVDGTKITPGTDGATVDWTGSGIEALTPGTYGLTFAARTVQGAVQKWVGHLVIVGAS